MKNTRENLIKLFSRLSDIKYEFSEIMKKYGDNELYKTMEAESYVYNNVVILMINKTFFNKIWEECFGEEGK